MKADVLVGGQFGSEGKGVVAALLANKYAAHVRVGGPNAGHSFVHEGRLWKMQAIPCGWINPKADIYIGPGGVVSLDVLIREIKDIEAAGYSIRPRLVIDPKAGLLEPRHAEEEGHTHGEMHKRIGSVGEGIGTCRRDRLMRDPTKFRNFGTALGQGALGDIEGVAISPIDYRLRHVTGPVLLEGTQGYGLSLIHGPWPFTTSEDTTAGTIAAQCGVGPKDVGEVIAVFRAMPIRVAGNSGPLDGEIAWSDLSRDLGRDVEERTTVTKKIRRIGAWDEKLFRGAVETNTPTQIVLTFADYMDPRNHMVTRYKDLSLNTRNLIDHIELQSNAPVVFVGTGFDEGRGWCYVDRR